MRRDFPVPTSYPRSRSANSAKNRLGVCKTPILLRKTALLAAHPHPSLKIRSAPQRRDFPCPIRSRIFLSNPATDQNARMLPHPGISVSTIRPGGPLPLFQRPHILPGAGLGAVASLFVQPVELRDLQVPVRLNLPGGLPRLGGLLFCPAHHLPVAAADYPRWG